LLLRTAAAEFGSIPNQTQTYKAFWSLSHTYQASMASGGSLVWVSQSANSSHCSLVRKSQRLRRCVCQHSRYGPNSTTLKVTAHGSYLCLLLNYVQHQDVVLAGGDPRIVPEPFGTAYHDHECDHGSQLNYDMVGGQFGSGNL